MSIITDFSKDLAKQITELRVLDLTELSFMIEMRLKMFVKDFVNEYATETELKYQKAKAELIEQKIGTSGYLIAANKLSVLKDRKRIANRAAFDSRKDDEYISLKHFLRDNGGENLLNEFYKTQTNHEPVFSQKLKFVDFTELLK